MDVLRLDFAHAVRELRHTERHVYNRLRSIALDREFVDAVRERLPELPLLGNLRCGTWYYPTFDETCYFKSTDGHYGKWDFRCSPPPLQKEGALWWT